LGYLRVTNAYTESANGLAKIMNRAGRGYGFGVIRARVLYGPDRVDPTEFVQCERCGIRFAAGMLVSQEPVTIGRGRKKNAEVQRAHDAVQRRVSAGDEINGDRNA
jgi:hypothetical protein